MKADNFLKNYCDYRGILIRKYRNFWGKYVFVIDENGTAYKAYVGKGIFEAFEVGSKITVGVLNRKLINIRPGLCKVHPVSYSEIPPWDEIVAYMKDKGLSGFADNVVEVMLSKDSSQRIIVLQSKSGYFTVLYEEIQVYEEDTWVYFCNDSDSYPAWWEPVSSSLNTASFYGSIDDALDVIKDSPEYKKYFT